MVILHIDELGKWNLLLANVNNLVKVMDDATNIEVLANGKAVTFYTKPNDTITKLKQFGVRFVACQNSLKGHKISAEQLIPEVSIVDVGVYELVRRQQEGYAYIKP